MSEASGSAILAGNPSVQGGADGSNMVKYLSDSQVRSWYMTNSINQEVLALQKQILVAGEEQTPGGRRNWLSLASIPGVEVRGYLKLPDTWFESRRARAVNIDQLLKDIMALGAEHIGTKNGEHFFGFPIVPGQTELKAPVVNTIRTYGASALETGLYAKWTGQ